MLTYEFKKPNYLEDEVSDDTKCKYLLSLSTDTTTPIPGIITGVYLNTINLFDFKVTITFTPSKKETEVFTLNSIDFCVLTGSKVMRDQLEEISHVRSRNSEARRLIGKLTPDEVRNAFMALMEPFMGDTNYEIKDIPKTLCYDFKSTFGTMTSDYSEIYHPSVEEDD